VLLLGDVVRTSSHNIQRKDMEDQIQYKNEKAIHNLTHSFFHGDSQLHPDVIIDILVNTVVVAVTI
jgi:hypothetical protein